MQALIGLDLPRNDTGKLPHDSLRSLAAAAMKRT